MIGASIDGWPIMIRVCAFYVLPNVNIVFSLRPVQPHQIL